MRMPSRTVVVAAVCRRGLFSPLAPCGSSIGMQTPGGRAALGLGFRWTALAEGQGYKTLGDVGEAATWNESQLSSLPLPAQIWERSEARKRLPIGKKCYRDQGVKMSTGLQGGAMA